MTRPTPELVIAVLQATTERARVQGDPIDLGDALERVRSLDAELSAWRRILRGRHVKAAECMCWQHFEFRYYRGGSPSPNDELGAARESLASALKVCAPTVLQDVSGMMVQRD